MAPPHRHHRSEIVITTAMFPFSWPQSKDYDRESECLKEVRERLTKLGIREDVCTQGHPATPEIEIKRKPERRRVAMIAPIG